MLVTLTMAVVISAAFFGKEFVYSWLDALGFDVQLLRNNAFPLIICTVFVVYGRVFTHHASNYEKIAIPTFFNQLLPKLVLPVLVFLAYKEMLATSQMVWLWSGTFGVIALGLLIYLKVIGGMDLKWDPGALASGRLKNMSVYAGYTGLSLMGSMLANRLDVIMVTLLLGESQNGIYLVVLFIASFLQIPTGAVWQIASPKISSAWVDNDMKLISRLYQRSSSNLFVSGIVLYLLCLGNIDAVFQLTADYESLRTGIVAFALLGGAKLFDMLTSVNTQILIYSRQFRVNTLFVVILGVVNIVLNYVLINKYGLTGAALATMISVLVYNIMKSTFLYFKHNLQPFSADFPRILLFSLLITGAYLVFPTISHPLLHIVVYTAVFGLLALLLIRFLKIDTDFIPFFQSKIVKYLDKWGSRFTRP